SIYVIDPQSSRFLEINEAAHTLLGYERDELLAKRVTDISITDPDPETWRRGVDQLRAMPYHIFAGEQIHKDGTTIPVEVNARLIRLDGREYMISVARDIRGRNRAAAAVVEEKNKLDAVLAALGDGLTMQDLQFRVIYQNEAHKKLQGDHIGELCYRAYHDGRTQVCDGCLLALCFADGKTHHRETSFLAANGETMHTEVSASPVRDALGNIYAGIEITRDITTRKLLEQDLIKRQKLESVGVLAGGIAHDFNNMLTAILGNISLAGLRLPLDSKPRRLIAAAEQACNRAKHLTQQLLTFSRGGTPVTHTASISSLIRESAAFTLRGSKAQCVVSPMANDLWLVEVDEGQLNQVIQNLVKNSEQAMPQGGSVYLAAENVEVSDAEIETLPGGKYVKITVKDEGQGMPAAMFAKIFDPYFTTKEMGNGLGLAVCYSIVKNHQGVITVDSREGIGSEFSLYLPASDKKLAPVKLDNVLGLPTKNRGRILLMDDDEMVQNVSAQLLRHLGYQVVIAEDGGRAAALFLAAQKSGAPFDAVILDLTIPGGMGGMETITRLLEIDPAVKAIVSSGYATDPIMANYKEYGFAAVIPKPFTLNELSQILWRVIYEDADGCADTDDDG
ncbi:MAG: PAS domain S-box protein, partial [Deltaproteobacteria bacterium]|nr:PAS domain S-box protein [Deltaproteobacteria bacterium]